MFEHMRNWRELMRRIAGWLDPGGKLFVHVFCHRRYAYPFDTDGRRQLAGTPLLHRRPDAVARSAAPLPGAARAGEDLGGGRRALRPDGRGLGRNLDARREEVSADPHRARTERPRRSGSSGGTCSSSPAPSCSRYRGGTEWLVGTLPVAETLAACGAESPTAVSRHLSPQTPPCESCASAPSCCSAPLPLLAQTPNRALNWDSLAAESVRNLSAYLAINTTNPPGNELAAARFLQQLLARDGIEAQILDTAELGPGRANLYARLRSSGTKKAIALVNHLDVVPGDAASSGRSIPSPGTVRDGYVWGRGALDMKGEGMVQLMAMIALKRSGVPLDRDIVFIGNADEELGGTGAETFVRRHADLLRDVEFLMTEGGDNLVDNGTARLLRRRGRREADLLAAALGARDAVPRLPPHEAEPRPAPRGCAVSPGALRNRRSTSPRASPSTSAISRTQYTGQQRAWLTDIAAALADSAARAWITDNVYWNAILRNTISLTVLERFEQDERHPRRGDGRDRHSTPARPGHGGGARRAGAGRGRYGGALADHPPPQGTARKSDRHRPVPRDRARRP